MRSPVLTGSPFSLCINVLYFFDAHHLHSILTTLPPLNLTTTLSEHTAILSTTITQATGQFTGQSQDG